MTPECQSDHLLGERIWVPLIDHGSTGPHKAVDLLVSGLNLMGNLLRGTFAEALVARETGGELQPEWTSWDIDLKPEASEPIRIEVKCSGYFQSWPQNSRSQIKWDIRPRSHGAYPDGTEFSLEPPRRVADVYVFALHLCADPFHDDHWRFWVVPTAFLNEKVGEQASITKGSLCSLVPDRVEDGLSIAELAPAVTSAA